MRGAAGFLALILGLCISSASMAAAPVFLVTDPAELQLVDLQPGYQYLTEQFSRRFDVLGMIRRAALRKMLKGWGVEAMPDKDRLELGTVARVTDEGRLEFVVVLRGASLDATLLRRRLVEKYGNHLRRHKLTPAPGTARIGGDDAVVLPLIDRTGEFVVAVVDGALLLASNLPGHHDLLEQTATVVAEGRREAAPASVRLHYDGYLTPEERRRVKEFFDRTFQGKVREYRRGFEALYKKLGEFDPEELKTTNEKINDLFLELVDWSLDYSFTAEGPVMGLTYRLRLPSEADAQAMRELLLEKVLFYRDNAGSPGIAATMDALALDVQGDTVVVTAAIDSEAGMYDVGGAYLAFLLSYSQADRYLGGE